MKAALFAISSMPHQMHWLGLLGHGLQQHGIAVEWLREGEASKDADFCACWGMSGRDRLLTDRPVLIVEAGFLGKRAVEGASLGWNNICGLADYCNAEVPGDRAKAWGHLLRPCRPFSGDYVLIMGQCAGDASWGERDPLDWYAEARDLLRQATSLPVLFRPHPRARALTGWNMTTGTLEEDFASAAGVVTFSSTSGVDAVLAGVPTIAMDRRSMVYGLVPHKPPFEELHEARRQRWLERLAYCQWTPEEFADGTAWDHIKAGLT